MSITVTGSIQASANLTTKFLGGTAGSGGEVNNIAPSSISIGSSQGAGRQFTEVWSQTYEDVDADFDLDLTALPGVGGRSVDFTTPGVRLIMVINGDPTAGHDIAVGPGASNGFAEPWPGTSAYSVAYGGMPGAGLVKGQAVGNTIYSAFCKPTALVVDATHKTVNIDPGANTVSALTVVIAG